MASLVPDCGDMACKFVRPGDMATQAVVVKLLHQWAACVTLIRRLDANPDPQA